MDEQKLSILFVDDELRILNALKRAFRKDPWLMFFASSGNAALDILSKNNMDLVISDLRMPEMDGLALFSIIKKKYPHIARIAFTGFAEPEMIKSVIDEIGVLQVISKPWNDAELRHFLVETQIKLKEQRKNSGDSVHILLNSIDSLPTLPAYYLELQKTFQNIENTSANKLADVIVRDPALSLRLLKWANSSLFGQANRVETILRALVVLGLNLVRDLVMTISVFESLAPVTKTQQKFDREAFWIHCQGCGVLARLIAKKTSASPVLADQAFTAGLLHDMGKLVFNKYRYDQFETAIATTVDQNAELYQTEKNILGITHMEIGYHLSKWWNLPEYISQTVRMHHNPNLCEGYPDLTRIVFVANAMIHKMNIGKSGTGKVPDITKSTLQKLGITMPELDALKDNVSQNLV